LADPHRADNHLAEDLRLAVRRNRTFFDQLLDA
jgi:hypothetical protein